MLATDVDQAGYVQAAHDLAGVFVQQAAIPALAATAYASARLLAAADTNRRSAIARADPPSFPLHDDRVQKRRDSRASDSRRVQKKTKLFSIDPAPRPKPHDASQLMATSDDSSSQSALTNSRLSASAAPAAVATTAQSKPKRVRTGCLTCRERHLKCDEAMPTCLNCRKSARECKRGVRLNFIDTQCEAPPTLAPNDDEWRLGFVDESRDVASEYTDGLGRYANLEALDPGPPPYSDANAAPGPTFEGSMAFSYSSGHSADPQANHHSLPSIQGVVGKNSNFFDQTELRQRYNTSAPDTAFSQNAAMSVGHDPHYNELNGAMDTQADQSEVKNLLDTADETLYMQVFVEEVGVWMDSMDPMKHFSRIMPFHALTQPMLLNAFLACGVRHLTLVNPPQFREEKALAYYDRASRHLLRALQNPNRDSVICATTAVILNVYEIMTEKALPRMNHIAGARALIRECGWSARSAGIGAACFWLNVGLETLSNLHFNWQMSWDPDDWGLDMDLSMETVPGREEVWTHRMLYIIAKICNHRAIASRAQGNSTDVDHQRRQKRMAEWVHLKGLLDMWENNSPRTMKPLAYLYPYQTTSKSAFPEVWIIKRTSVIARLFYHTANVLLSQSNSAQMDNMKELELHHAHMICGIVAHVKDRGVASVALRCLAHAAEALTNRREQEEVLEIFTRIHRETGWRIGFIPKDLCDKWGWAPDETTKTSPQQLPTHKDPTSHLSPQQQQRMAAQAAVAAASAGINVSSSLPDNVMSPTALSLGSPGAQGQYQFDQYAEMQQRKAQQHAQQQTQRPSSTQGSSPPIRKMPQGIVNPVFANGMPKSYQEWFVPPASAPTDQSQGLGLGLSNVNHLYSNGGHGGGYY